MTISHSATTHTPEVITDPLTYGYAPMCCRLFAITTYTASVFSKLYCAHHTPTHTQTQQCLTHLHHHHRRLRRRAIWMALMMSVIARSMRTNITSPPVGIWRAMAITFIGYKANAKIRLRVIPSVDIAGGVNIECVLSKHRQ